MSPISFVGTNDPLASAHDPALRIVLRELVDFAKQRNELKAAGDLESAHALLLKMRSYAGGFIVEVTDGPGNTGIIHKTPFGGIHTIMVQLPGSLALCG